MGEEKVISVIGMLRELHEDNSVPKNVRIRLETTIQALEDKTETSIKVSRALHELEALADDNNMESYTRMQLLSIVSALEMIA